MKALNIAVRVKYVIDVGDIVSSAMGFANALDRHRNVRHKNAAVLIGSHLTFSGDKPFAFVVQALAQRGHLESSRSYGSSDGDRAGSHPRTQEAVRPVRAQGLLAGGSRSRIQDFLGIVVDLEHIYTRGRERVYFQLEFIDVGIVAELNREQGLRWRAQLRCLEVCGVPVDIAFISIAQSQALEKLYVGFALDDRRNLLVVDNGSVLNLCRQSIRFDNLRRDVAVFSAGPIFELVLTIHQYTRIHAPDLQVALVQSAAEIWPDMCDVARDQLLRVILQPGGDGYLFPNGQTVVVDVIPGAVALKQQRYVHAKHSRQFLIQLYFEAHQIVVQLLDLTPFDLNLEVVVLHGGHLSDRLGRYYDFLAHLIEIGEWSNPETGRLNTGRERHRGNIQAVVSDQHGAREALEEHRGGLARHGDVCRDQLSFFGDLDIFDAQQSADAREQDRPRRYAGNRHRKARGNDGFLPQQGQGGEEQRVGIADVPPLQRLAVVSVSQLIQPVARFDGVAKCAGHGGEQAQVRAGKRAPLRVGRGHAGQFAISGNLAEHRLPRDHHVGGASDVGQVQHRHGLDHGFGVQVRHALAFDHGEAHADAGADRIQIGAELCLRDVHAVDVDRQHPLPPENEQNQRRVRATGKAEAARSAAQQRTKRRAEEAFVLGIDHLFERRDLRGDAELFGDRVSIVQLVGGIQADVEIDRLLIDGHELLLLKIEQIGKLAVKLAQRAGLRLARWRRCPLRWWRRVRNREREAPVARQLERVELKHHEQRRQAQAESDRKAP